FRQPFRRSTGLCNPASAVARFDRFRTAPDGTAYVRSAYRSAYFGRRPCRPGANRSAHLGASLKVRVARALSPALLADRPARWKCPPISQPALRVPPRGRCPLTPFSTFLPAEPPRFPIARIHLHLAAL